MCKLNIDCLHTNAVRFTVHDYRSLQTCNWPRISKFQISHLLNIEFQKNEKLIFSQKCINNVDKSNFQRTKTFFQKCISWKKSPISLQAKLTDLVNWKERQLNNCQVVRNLKFGNGSVWWGVHDRSNSTPFCN